MSIYIYLGPGLRFSRLKSAHARHFVCTVAINFLDIEYVGVNLLSRFIFSKVYRNIPKPIELEIRWNRSMESCIFFFPSSPIFKQLTVNDSVLILFLLLYARLELRKKNWKIEESIDDWNFWSSSVPLFLFLGSRKSFKKERLFFDQEFDRIQDTGRRKSSLKVHNFVVDERVPFQERLIITRLSLDEGVKFETAIVLGRDSNSVTQSLPSKSIWRRRWSRVSLPIHRVTLFHSLSLWDPFCSWMGDDHRQSVVPRWIFTDQRLPFNQRSFLESFNFLFLLS